MIYKKVKPYPAQCYERIPIAVNPTNYRFVAKARGWSTYAGSAAYNFTHNFAHHTVLIGMLFVPLFKSADVLSILEISAIFVYLLSFNE